MHNDQDIKYTLTLNNLGHIVPAQQAEWLRTTTTKEWLPLAEASVLLGVATHQLYARRYLVPQYVSKTEDNIWVLHRRLLEDSEAVHLLTVERGLGHSRQARKVFCVELNRVFRTIGEAAEAIGVSGPTVRLSARHGTRCKAGYTFHYV